MSLEWYMDEEQIRYGSSGRKIKNQNREGRLEVYLSNVGMGLKIDSCSATSPAEADQLHP
jgi:hypothetical protein